MKIRCLRDKSACTSLRSADRRGDKRSKCGFSSLRVLNFKERSVWAGGKKEKPREASNANNKISVRVGIVLFFFCIVINGNKSCFSSFQNGSQQKYREKKNFFLVVREKIMSACNKSPYLCMDVCVCLRVCACVHACGCVCLRWRKTVTADSF